MDEIVIVGAKRTPIGSFLGSLSSLTASDLGAHVIKAALEQSCVAPSEVSEVIMGQVLTAGVGMNAARQSAIKAGVPVEKTAITVNQVCGSGLRAIILGAQSLLLNDADVIVAGGQASMSRSNHVVYMREGLKMGSSELKDTMVYDGLWDIFNNYHMGVTAENLAKKYNISRAEQDEFAYKSQMKAKAAIEGGRFKDEIAPITVKTRKGDIIVDKDEYPRADTTIEKLSALKPAFAKDGTVTAGNASGVNDGASALVLMRKSDAVKRGLNILATIKSYATAGVDPSLMGIGPVAAVKEALKKASWNIADLDLIEGNEAFAVQALAVDKELGWDINKVNINGGAVALGHPIGASGARILTTLIYEMIKQNHNKGVATLCVGGGMGVAVCIER